MIKIKRYYTALRRYNRSKGFGIHSPFAFNFVLKVLRERSQYYAYDNLHSSHWNVSRLTTAKERRNLISYKYAKMIFRITCYFNPQSILQIGTSHGIVSTALLNVSSSSHLYVYLGEGHHAKTYELLIGSEESRITKYNDVIDALDNYQKLLNDANPPFVIINHIDKENKKIIKTALDVVKNEGIIIICNINRNKIVRDSWNEIKSSMQQGMSFSNDKIGVIVGYKHLPLQHFSLWF